MKKKVLFVPLFVLFSIFCFDSTVKAQNDEFYSSRLGSSVAQLKQRTVDLVDRTSQNLRRGQTANRAEIEEAFLAVQIDAVAGLFDQMTRDNRRAAELRDAAALLSDLSRRAPSYGSSNFLWRDIQRSIADINRELGNSGGNTGGNSGGNNGGNTGGNDPAIVGRAFWRGTVDDRIQIRIRDRELQVETVAGRPYPEGTFSFTSALPNRRVTVEVNKQKGRGNVRVVQQPSRENDFTTVIEVADTEGGAKEYQLEIFWRRD
jgi:hypothetical protein